MNEAEARPPPRSWPSKGGRPKCGPTSSPTCLTTRQPRKAHRFDEVCQAGVTTAAARLVPPRRQLVPSRAVTLVRPQAHASSTRIRGTASRSRCRCDRRRSCCLHDRSASVAQRALGCADRPGTRWRVAQQLWLVARRMGGASLPSTPTLAGPPPHTHTCTHVDPLVRRRWRSDCSYRSCSSARLQTGK